MTDLEVLTKIHVAFTGRNSPRVWCDEPILYPEEREALIKLRNARRGGMSLREYEGIYDVLPLLNPPAFCYVLPDIMRASIECTEAVFEDLTQSLAVDFIIGDFDRPVVPEYFDSRFLAISEELTCEELEAIEVWFWYVSERCGKMSGENVFQALNVIVYLEQQKCQSVDATKRLG